MRLILARHGQSFVNVDPATYAGQDAPLTPLGEQQAERLGRWLKEFEPDIEAITCSPLRRAQQTAEIVNAHLQLPLSVDERLAEIERYDLPLLPRRTHPLQPETAHNDPGADGYYERYKGRVKEALADLLADLMRPKPMLVVSHGGTSATILRLIMERHDVYFLTNNTGLHFVEWTDGRWRIHGLNQLRHLTPDLIS
ncbi:MAG: histidine phosphatase family protein [Anaerolineae bacterium]|nr:histidine phosphatase family protein [Anaerolineae bacterium]